MLVVLYEVLMVVYELTGGICQIYDITTIVYYVVI